MLDHAGLKLSAAIGTTGVVAQTLTPTEGQHILERLGVAGILVVGAYFMLRYFMGVVTAKDTQINILFERQQEAAEEHTQMLLTHLERGYDVQRGITNALNELTGVVRALKDDRQ